MTFVTAEIYAFGLIACGCWTQRRYAGPLRQSGGAAMRMSLIAGLPIVVCALLIMLGVIDLTFTPSDRVRPLPGAMLISPLLRLPEAWIWGMAGGLCGRWLARPRDASETLRDATAR
jgi:hypothetical protein